MGKDWWCWRVERDKGCVEAEEFNLVVGVDKGDGGRKWMCNSGKNHIVAQYMLRFYVDAA